MPVCTTYPATPRIYGNPEYISYSPIIGWNAGANSIKIQSGDCYCSWQVNNEVVGAVMGFSPPSRPSYRYADLTHALIVISVNGAKAVQVMESGRYKTAVAPLSNGSTLRIQRLRDDVEYLINGVVIYTSDVLSMGTIRAGAVLYSSGDKII